MLPNLTFSRRRHRALRAFFRLLLYQANYPVALDYAHSLADFRETLRALLVDSDGLFGLIPIDSCAAGRRTDGSSGLFLFSIDD